MNITTLRDAIGASTPGSRHPVHSLTIEGRRCEVWGKAPTQEPTSWHDLCWTVTVSPLPGEAALAGGYFTYPHACIVPIQSMRGWVGVRVGLGHQPPFPEGWFIHPAHGEYLVYGFARTPCEAWQIAAEALHQEVASQLKGRK